MTRSLPEGRHEQTLAFIDTNTLHYLDLYLRQAKHYRLFPYEEHQEKVGDHICRAEQALQRLEPKVPSKEEKGLLQAYQNGARALAFLRSNDARIQYSPVSELELSVGRIKGRALLGAANEQVPDRKWSRLVTNEREVELRVGQRDIRKVRMRVIELKERLAKVGINVMEGNSGPMREVWDVAREIIGLLYVSIEDCIIFADALVTSATYLLTADSYLRKIVNRMHNPGNKHDKNTRREISEHVARITLHESEAVVFPLAPKYWKEGYGGARHEMRQTGSK